MQLFKLTFAIVTLLIAFNGATSQEKEITTAVIPVEDAHVTQFDGSKFLTYFAGQSVGAKGVITGVGIIEPNKEIHPPHKHNEEEYLMVIKGSGEWTINDKKFKANTGDILYAGPGDLHGIFNTGKTDLKFVVFKWKSK